MPLRRRGTGRPPRERRRRKAQLLWPPGPSTGRRRPSAPMTAPSAMAGRGSGPAAKRGGEMCAFAAQGHRKGVRRRAALEGKAFGAAAGNASEQHERQRGAEMRAIVACPASGFCCLFWARRDSPRNALRPERRCRKKASFCLADPATSQGVSARKTPKTKKMKCCSPGRNVAFNGCMRKSAKVSSLEQAEERASGSLLPVKP